MEFLAARHRDLALDLAVLQVQLCGNESQSLLFHLALKFVDFLPVQKQLSLSHRLVVFPIAVRVLADMRVEQPRFVALDIGVAFFELHLAGLRGLHFRSAERNSGLIFFEQMVVVPGLAVVAQDAVSRFVRWQVFDSTRNGRMRQ